MTLLTLAAATSGLPRDLWDPLAPDRAAAPAPGGGVSLALVLALFALVLVAGFLIGEYLPLHRRAPAA